ncbi:MULTISPECIES: hypothetical protein [Natrinema]|uniref:Uncharacterized protein n=1 Tax=Natrinema gari JCM 14663 TaxID=1230459 RepID=L9YSL3_9EURY|nr:MULTISPECIES: hypothetical protein [Natrinema]AFO58836.1 hypothetical protein NJ7G_3619 [Natrinema sp. J7-2]ELY77104.1 hypothetical protein C486_16675 [Natrinema gari JCM 14663]
MSALIDAAVLTTETEPVLPMQLVGWGALALGLLVTVAWLLSFYR